MTAAPTDTTLDDVLTTSEAAALLRLSGAHLKRMRARGDGPVFLKISSRLVRYRRRDLLAWLEQHTKSISAR